MKKKLLFFGYTMDMGGAEKVMVDFLKVLLPHYEIDLALLQAKGELMQDLPEGIRVIQMRNSLPAYVLFRYIPFFRKWKINKIANGKDYHAAIGFMEGRSATWVADIKKPIRKIAWVHNDVDHFNIGIPEKDRERIFDRFYRTDASRNSSQGGSGIGLSIVKKIIEDHGGYIWATSKEGVGTCMHFVIRRYHEQENN